MVRFNNYGIWWIFILKKIMKNTIYKIPLIFTFFIFIFLLYFLIQDKNPSIPQSALINKNIPKFQANDLLNENLTFNNEILSDKKAIINFFASWCSPCKVEHPILIKISENHKNIILLGINHKDKKNDAIKYLNAEGNPYDFIGVDGDGFIGLEFGVFGLPETFLVNSSGIIINKILGPLTKKIIKDEIKPFIK